MSVRYKVLHEVLHELFRSGGPFWIFTGIMGRRVYQMMIFHHQISIPWSFDEDIFGFCLRIPLPWQGFVRFFQIQPLMPFLHPGPCLVDGPLGMESQIRPDWVGCLFSLIFIGESSIGWLAIAPTLQKWGLETFLLVKMGTEFTWGVRLRESGEN